MSCETGSISSVEPGDSVDLRCEVRCALEDGFMEGAIVDSNGSCEIRVTIAGRTGTAHMDLKENKTFNAGTRNIFSINLVGDDIVLQLRPTDTWEDDGDSDIVFE